MQSFHVSFSPFLFLSLLFLSSFHGDLVNGQVVFDFPTKNITLSPPAKVDPSGNYITLDSSTAGSDAQAFYSTAIPLTGSSTTSVASFQSFFTFASNAATGNGTIAFALVPQGVTLSLAEARKTLTIEFNASCSTGVGGEGYYRGGYGGPFNGGGPNYMGGFGGFQVIEYENNASSLPQNQSGYGPNWSGQGQFPSNGPFFCSQQQPQDIPNPTFQYQVVVEYNASSDTVWVGSPSCGDNVALTTQFPAPDLSSIITKPVQVGFIVSGGGIFNITQWNFTTNVNTSGVFSLALQASTNPVSGIDGSSINGGMGHSGGSKLKKGYIIAFSILGAAIGVAAVLLVCCLCIMRRKRVTSARFVAKGVHGGTIPESAVVFDAKKPPAPPARVVLVDRDTTPLNPHPNSTFHASTGAASWLHPVAPR